jgi:hypothetical protein
MYALIEVAERWQESEDDSLRKLVKGMDVLAGGDEYAHETREALARENREAFDECIRLRAIRKAIRVADAMTVRITDDWKEKEKILRVLKEEESAVQDWLHYKRELPSEYHPDLPLNLRTKIPQVAQKSPEDFTARLKSSGADDIEIAGQLKRFYPDLLPSRIGRLTYPDPSIKVVNDAYRKRGCRLLEKYEKRKKNTLGTWKILNCRL